MGADELTGVPGLRRANGPARTTTSARSTKKAALVLCVWVALGNVFAGCKATQRGESPERPEAAPISTPGPGPEASPGGVPGVRGNVLLIIADDLGIDKVGVYGAGDEATRPRTPNIDRLAAEGVRFNNAFAHPICSPTRASMLTGRHAFRTGVGQAIRPRRGGEYGLPLEEITLPELLDLAGSGYDHSLVGKWHIGVPTLGGPNNPLMQGFAWAAASEGSVQDYFSWPKHVNGKYVGSDVYSTVDLTDAAIARANQMRSPWLLWLAYHAPHMPFHIPPRDLQERDLRPGDVIGMHAAMVEAMDHEIGRLLASIDPAVLARTTIVFIGDNGTDSAAVPSEIHERAKGSLFEGGIHVPLIVSGAAVTPRARGRTCERLVQALDLFATIAELAKVSPANSMPPDHPLDSASFLPLLSDPDGPSPRRYVYVEKFKPNGPGPYSEYDQTILDDRWKLLRQHDWTRGRYTDLFFDRGRTTPGHEGEDLCPCPEKLTGESRAAYERLAKQMAEIRNP